MWVGGGGGVGGGTVPPRFELAIAGVTVRGASHWTTRIPEKIGEAVKIISPSLLLHTATR